MKTKIRKIVIATLFVTSSFSFGQKISTENWTENEKNQYSKLIELANYVYKKEKTEISKDSLFKKYIYFDYVLNDTVSARKEKRLVAFDTIFYPFRKNLDSLGIKSLDAKPVRFYKNHKIYEPFKEEIAKETISGEKMFTKDSNVFAYYKKEDPENPLGTLLFETKTNKLVSWIMMDQGGYIYFLTFNLF